MIHKQQFRRSNTVYYYWTQGNTRNPPMLLIPGFTGTHGDLLDFARKFSKNYFVITADLPGWGDSPKNGYHLTIQGYAQFLHDLLHSLALRKKIFLVGHCMGSVVAIEFASRFVGDVEEVFLVGTPYLGGNFSESIFYHLAQSSTKVPKILRPLLYFFRSRLFAIPMGFFVIQTKSLRKKISIIFNNTLKQQFQDEELIEKNWNSLVLYNYAAIRKITVPIHIFHGEKDILVQPIQAEKLAHLTRNTTVDIIPHAGHIPPVETPQALAHAMEKYLR